MDLRDRLLGLLRTPWGRAGADPEHPEQRGIGTSLTPFVPADEIGWGPARVTTPTNYSQTGANVRRIGWESNATVNACASTVAEALGAVPIQTYTKKNDDGSPTPQKLDAPARLVLDRPRVGMTRYAMWGLIATHFQIYGNAFFLLERPSPGASPKALRLIHPEDILLVLLDRESLEILAFDWRDRLGRVHRAEAQDIVHFRDLSCGDWIFGYPRAAAALLEMASDREANDMVRQWLVNDATPGHVALVEDGATARDTRDAEARFRAQQVDRGGRGGVRFLRGIKDWKTIGFNLQQLEFPSLRSISGEKICSAFRVDPRIVGANSAKGNEGGLSQAGWAEARRRLYAQTVIPMMRTFESTLDQEYSVEWGDVFCRFDPDELSLLIETQAERSDRAKGLLSAGMITRQESRRIIRLPEEMVASDILVGSMGRLEYPVVSEFINDPKATVDPKQVLALTTLMKEVALGNLPADTAKGIITAAFPYLTEADIAAIIANAEGFAPVGASDSPIKPTDANKPLPPGSPPAADPKALPPADNSAGEKPVPPAQKAAPVLIDQPRRVLKRGMLLSKSARQQAWAMLDARATKAEAPYKRAALTLFGEEQRDIVTSLKAGHAPSTKGRASFETGPTNDPVVAEALRRIRANYKPGGKYHQAWLEQYRALIAESIGASGASMATDLSASFSLTNPRVEAAILDRATFLTNNVTDYSSQVITSIIAEGQRQGLGVGEIADLLQVAFGTMSPGRAATIARTETIGALNTGEYLAAQASEILITKEWLGEDDGRERDSHVELNGVQLPMEERFDNGLLHPGESGGAPEEVINCRCSLLFYDQ